MGVELLLLSQSPEHLPQPAELRTQPAGVRALQQPGEQFQRGGVGLRRLIEVRTKLPFSHRYRLRHGHRKQSLGTLRHAPAACAAAAEWRRGVGRRSERVVDRDMPGRDARGEFLGRLRVRGEDRRGQPERAAVGLDTASSSESNGMTAATGAKQASRQIAASGEVSRRNVGKSVPADTLHRSGLARSWSRSRFTASSINRSACLTCPSRHECHGIVLWPRASKLLGESADIAICSHKIRLYGDARLPAVEGDAEPRGLRGHFHIRVGQHEHRVATGELECRGDRAVRRGGPRACARRHPSR